MTNINHSSAMTISCLCGVMLLWPVAAHGSALPPDPDNAALLYYQAFLHRPQSDRSTTVMLRDVLHGAEPNQEVRQYLEDCHEMVEFAEAAVRIPQCNWGVRYSQGRGLSSQVMVQLRALAQLLYADARILAADGEYRAALERCLTTRRLAGHIGEATLISYLVSLAIDARARLGICDVLASMPLDANTLTWLQGRLVAVRAAPQSPASALEMDFQLTLQAMRIDADFLAWLRQQLAEGLEDPTEVQNLTDEDLLTPAQELYTDFLNSVLRVMDSEMPYEQKYAEIEMLTDDLLEEAGDLASKMLALFCGQRVPKSYGLHVRHRAGFNALRAAIEIYIVKAETGQLPETLPENLPKDPFSGEDFEYETTEDGFVLRCRGKDMVAGEVPQYQFKVQR